MSTGFTGPIIGYQVISNFAAGGVLYLLAWALFDRFTREQRTAGPARNAPVRRRSFFGNLAPKRAWSSALVWKDYYFLTGGKSTMLIKFVLFALLLGLIAFLNAWNGRQLSFTRIDWEMVGCITVIVMLIIMGVELAYHAGRVFKEEVRWKTLGSIAVLPVSMGKIAWCKVVACLMTQLPGLVFVVIGLVVADPDFTEELFRAPGEPFFWYLIAQYLLFVYVTVLLSLWLKWGGLAVALVAVYIGNSCVVGLFAMLLTLWSMPGTGGFEEALPVLMAIGTFGVIVVLHVLIGRSLHKRAAD